MACSPVPRCSQSRQQQTAECRLESGACRAVETAAVWLPIPWRAVDSDNSKDRAVEEGGQSFPTPTEQAGKIEDAYDSNAAQGTRCHVPIEAAFQLLRVFHGLETRSIYQRAHFPIVL